MDTRSMSQIRFTIEGEAVGKGRARSVTRPKKGGGSYIAHVTPQRTVDYEQRVASAAAQAMGFRSLIEGPVMVELKIFVGVPASYTKANRAAALSGQMLPTKKPDADNVLKAIKDAMNGVVYFDDQQVTDVHISKRFAETPRVIVIVTPLNKRGST